MRAAVDSAGGDGAALSVLAPLPLAWGSDRTVDLGATMDRVLPMGAAGVTDFLVHLRVPTSFGGAQDAFAELAAAFKDVTGA